jgi:E3 ubiquitin-protein ligase UBR7
VDLILGGDEGTECTYSQGYKNRQAIFSCRTCTPDGNAGFCTACSLSCHEGHDVLELWTRRRFRCDCGNSKFGVGICRLQVNKEPENSCNIYNQNYKGVYCICKRPHPDPDLPEQCEMLQCCICEDWFHEHHLGLPPFLQVLFSGFCCQEMFIKK